MFNTLKSKILITAISMLLVLITVFVGFTYVYYKNTKNLSILSCSREIRGFVEDINQQIAKIEINTKDLALIGELYYKLGSQRDQAQDAFLRLIGRNDLTIGGGIWFKPYLIIPDQKLFCMYALQKGTKAVIDKNFGSKEYNYPNQNWYKEIISKITPEHNIAWTYPYIAQEGSRSTIITVGAGIYDEYNNLLGISTLDWEIGDIISFVNNMKPTPNSFAVFADEKNDYIIASNDPYQDNKILVGQSLSVFPWYSKRLGTQTNITYHNQNYILYVNKLDNGMLLIVNVPKDELFYSLGVQVVMLILILLIISSAITMLLYNGLESNILKPINKEREQISSELAIARAIQESSLPNIFPPFPDRKEFEIFASMKAAKEVGGDFYDFYFLDDDNFMFLIADVSGKGIPAALFMMTSKTLINNLAQMGYNYDVLIQKINEKICANNQYGYFVTMFGAIINLKTGKMTCINCGHNPPLIKHGFGQFKYLNIEPNIVLGVFPKAKFEVYEIQLNPNDILFIYTDGITEALNKKNQMFGEERLKLAINQDWSSDIHKLTSNIRKNLYDFTMSSPQSDDMTMLIFKYLGAVGIKTYKNVAIKENYNEFYKWLSSACAEFVLNPELTNKIEMCAEEIFANIIFHAYPEEKGDIEVNFKKKKSAVMLEFIDSGIPYNILESPDPDITLPPSQRASGGLGNYMVKQMANNIQYKRENNKNILTISFFTIT